MALDTAWPWANDTYGLCCLRAYFCAHRLILARSYAVIPTYSPNRDSYGVLAANKNELAARAFERVSVLWCARLRLAAALVGRWRRCRCCQLAKCTVLVWRCRKLAAQAAYILVPASRMSTGRGILPSYLGLCWCYFVYTLFSNS